MWRKLLLDPFERIALIVSILSLILVVVRAADIPVWPALADTPLATPLRSEVLKSLIDIVCGGVFSAYIFYILIEYLPTYRKEQQALTVLDLLTGTILEAFKHGSISDHEITIDGAELRLEDMAKTTRDNILLIKNCKVGYLRYKSAIETSDSRYADFGHALGLAMSISPEHAKQWLILTDKVRLMMGECKSWPENLNQLILSDFDNINNPKYALDETACHFKALQKRVLDFMREARNWAVLSGRTFNS